MKTKLLVEMHACHMSEFALRSSCMQNVNTCKNNWYIIMSPSGGYGVYFCQLPSQQNTGSLSSGRILGSPEAWFWKINPIFQKNHSSAGTPVSICKLVPIILILFFLPTVFLLLPVFHNWKLPLDCWASIAILSQIKPRWHNPSSLFVMLYNIFFAELILCAHSSLYYFLQCWSYCLHDILIQCYHSSRIYNAGKHSSAWCTKPDSSIMNPASVNKLLTLITSCPKSFGSLLPYILSCALPSSDEPYSANALCFIHKDFHN